jgi:hypothetical protein
MLFFEPDYIIFLPLDSRVGYRSTGETISAESPENVVTKMFISDTVYIYGKLKT